MKKEPETKQVAIQSEMKMTAGGVPIRNITEILTDICQNYGITLERIQGPIRTKMLVQARMDFAKKAYKECGASATEIGKILGHRDHTTILHYLHMKERVKKPKSKVGPDNDPVKNMAKILMDVCKGYGISLDDIRGPARTTMLIRARKVFAKRAQKEWGASSTEIGIALGNRDHTTILHYLHSEDIKS